MSFFFRDFTEKFTDKEKELFEEAIRLSREQERKNNEIVRGKRKKEKWWGWKGPTRRDLARETQMKVELEGAAVSTATVLKRKKTGETVTLRRAITPKQGATRLPSGLVRISHGVVRMNKTNRELIFKRQEGQHFRPKTRREMEAAGKEVTPDIPRVIPNIRREKGFGVVPVDPERPGVVFGAKIGKKYEEGWYRDTLPTNDVHFCSYCNRETPTTKWRMVKTILFFGQEMEIYAEAWACRVCGNEDWKDEEKKKKEKKGE
jgi:hypothetical protein